jgi:hypothetical protein
VVETQEMEDEMLKIILTVSMLLSTQFGWAAIPPMTQEMRELEATYIIEGQILSVQKELVNVRGEDKHFKDWDITAQVAVSKFLKSEDDDEENSKTIDIKYWKSGMRPRDWAGPQGQNGWISKGDQVRLFMKRNADADHYDLLMPNGWEALSETQTYYIDTLDDMDVWEDAESED